MSLSFLHALLLARGAKYVARLRAAVASAVNAGERAERAARAPISPNLTQLVKA